MERIQVYKTKQWLSGVNLTSKRWFRKLKVQKDKRPSSLIFKLYKSMSVLFLLSVLNKILFISLHLATITHLFLKFSPFQQLHYCFNLKMS